MTSKSETTAFGFYAAAKSYLMAAHTLWRHPVEDEPERLACYLPRHLLISLSLELYLKAWMRQKGVHTSKLSAKPYGHNLTTLYAKSQATGFPPSVLIEGLIAHLHNDATLHSFRYIPENHIYHNTNFSAALVVLDALDAKMRSEVQPLTY